MRSKVDFRLPGKRIRRAAILIGSSAFAAVALASPGTARAATTPAAAHASPAAAGAKAAAARFSMKSAAAWALANVKTSNNAFPDDCADFVSRALQAGGYPFSYIPSVIVTNSTNDKYWYYFTTRYGRHYPHSWSVAHDLAVHLVDMKSKRVLNPKNAQPGDVIFANWKGSSFSGISHVGIITGMSNGVPLITQHSPSQKNISLSYWLKHGGPDVHVWIYSPNP